MSQILVIGANGTVGTELVKILKSKGHQVRSATSKTKTTAEQVHVNLLTGDGLEGALKNIDQAFLLSPPGHVNQNELLIPVINKAKSAGVKKIVLMTAMGANAVETAPLRQVEIHLEKSGLSYNIIRPNWFMQNFNTYWLHGILTQSQILLPVASAKGSFIDARDIAAVAAVLLTTDQFNNQDFDLTGSESLDHNQVASLLSKATNKKISYQEITPSQMFEGLLAAGLPRPYSEFMLMILDFFKQGYAERKTDAVEKITGRKPISFATYANDFKKAFVSEA